MDSARKLDFQCDTPASRRHRVFTALCACVAR